MKINVHIVIRILNLSVTYLWIVIESNVSGRILGSGYFQ